MPLFLWNGYPQFETDRTLLFGTGYYPVRIAWLFTPIAIGTIGLVQHSFNVLGFSFFLKKFSVVMLSPVWIPHALSDFNQTIYNTLHELLNFWSNSVGLMGPKLCFSFQRDKQRRLLRLSTLGHVGNLCRTPLWQWTNGFLSQSTLLQSGVPVRMSKLDHLKLRPSLSRSPKTELITDKL